MTIQTLNSLEHLVQTSVQATKRWWRSIDRVIFMSTLFLMLVGITLSFATSPVAASRLDLADSLFIVRKQIVFMSIGCAILLGVSMLKPIYARRLGVLVLLGSLVLMLIPVLFGPEINGARRWISLGGFSLQPSELMKPGFVMAAAWLLSEGARDKSFPGGLIALMLYGCLSLILLMQPDYGQWLLLTGIWAVMFFIAGWSWLWIGGLGLAASGALFAGYNYAPHVASRIDRFLNPESGDTYQVDKAMEALSGGGLFGHDIAGKADGVKYSLPDAHTDYIFAVAGEEFGFFLCAFILTLFAVLVMRSFMRSSEQTSIFLQTAICGLGALIGFQALINMGVNLNVIPSKGMTLPFISSGGSSMFASCLTIGLLLSLTRKGNKSWRSRDQLV